MNSGKIKMEVNIAGEIISLTVPFSRQDAVRNAEAELAALYKMWSREFPSKTPKELLAMIAYRFASAYLDLKSQQDEELQEAEQLLDTVSRLCSEECDREPDVCRDTEFPLY